MTHYELVTEIIREHGPVTDADVYHYARAKGFRPSSESIRTRRSEAVKAGLVKSADATPGPRGVRRTRWIAA